MRNLKISHYLVMIFSYMLKSLLPVFFFMLAVVACKQPANQQVASIDSDSVQVEKLIAKGEGYTGSNTDSLLVIANQLKAISGNKTALIYAQIFEAHYNWSTTNYNRAIPIALHALSEAEKWNIKRPIPGIYLMIANIHKENGNYNAAFKDADDGLKAARLTADTTSIIALLGLKAMFTHSYYLKKDRREDDHTSLNMEFEALKIAESNPKYERGRIKFYNNIAQTYKEQGDYANTLLYANKAVVLANKYNQLRSLTYSYNWLGEAYYNMGNYAKGIGYLNSAIAVSRQLKLPYREMELYEAMYWRYLSTKNYEPAIASLNRFTKMRDSLQIAKNEKQISELQMKYETGKKDKQITSLGLSNTDKNRKILWISTGMLFFVILLVVILRQYFTIHKYSRLMEANNEQLNYALLKIAYIQSHQIRKPLASIMGLMNIIKAHNYEPDKEVLQKMDEASHELDQRIRDVIRETEIVD